MINVNQITAQLARMPDQALQQYAQMNKSDPYILSLALSESNRRKQMREGAQAQAPEQPKVVDQAVASMAAPMPEDVGIAQLPAGEMEFAAGGIVAFDEGGEVPGYSAGGSMFGFDVTPGQMEADEMRRRQAIMGMSREDRLRRFGTVDVEQALRGGAFAAPAAATTPSAVLPTATTPTPTPTPAPAPAPAPALRREPAPRREPGPGAATASQAGLPAIAAMQSPSQMYQSALEAVPLVDPAAGLRDELGKELVGGAERRLAGRRAELEKEGDVFKGREERIGKREEALGKERESMTGLAFLEAGLAVMSTPGGLATALGKGARVGTERFAAGLDKIRAAQERLEDAKDGLETLRLNRSDMNAKEIRGLEADVYKAKTDAKKLGIDGLMQASDLRYKQAGELFKVIGEQEKTRFTEAGALQRQRIASDAAIRAAAMRPSTDDRTMASIVAEYAKNPTKLKILEQTDPVMAQMIRAQLQALNVPAVQAQPGAGGARP